MTATSTDEPSGSDVTPIAALAWRPGWPSTSTNRSLAPLATAGCPVNPWALATYTVTWAMPPRV
jgi:hypothetical protein